MTETPIFENRRYCEECHCLLPTSYEGTLCPRCLEQELFHQVKEYIQSNNATAYDVATHFHLPLSRIKEWIDDGMIGILDIPKMNVTLPIYLGATQEKMAKGAVMLGQTSFPVQGTDSNCVIAAHRGWKGIPMFREIERLEIGDELTIQNCQETLTYRVSEIEIILPDESDKIMIQPGRNMVTLMTCHPYTQNSRRYVVYCDEVGTQPEAAVDAAEEADSSQQEIITTSEQNRTEALEEDQRLIERDTLWRKAGYVGIGLIGVLIIFGFIPRKKH